MWKIGKLFAEVFIYSSSLERVIRGGLMRVQQLIQSDVTWSFQDEIKQIFIPVTSH